MAVGYREQLILFRRRDNECGARTYVNVNGNVVVIFFEEGIAKHFVPGDIRASKTRQSVYYPAHIFYFLVIVAFSAFVDKEIELQNRPVNFSVNIHD